MHEDGDVNIKAHANMEREGDACYWYEVDPSTFFNYIFKPWYVNAYILIED